MSIVLLTKTITKQKLIVLPYRAKYRRAVSRVINFLFIIFAMSGEIKYI